MPIFWRTVTLYGMFKLLLVIGLTLVLAMNAAFPAHGFKPIRREPNSAHVG